MLGAALATNAELVNLSVAKNELGSDGAAALVRGVEKSSLQTLVIGKAFELPLGGGNPFGSDVLSLSDEGIDSGHATLLAWWLATPAARNLTEVDVTRNRIGIEGAVALAEALARAPSLRCVSIRVAHSLEYSSLASSIMTVIKRISKRQDRGSPCRTPCSWSRVVEEPHESATKNRSFL